jgi:hypothetical protein
VFAPDSVNTPAPAFVNAAEPLNTPESATSDATVSVVAPVIAAEPEKLSAPLLVASPSVTSPAKFNAFASARAVAPSLDNPVPVANVTAPAPNASALPTRNAPPETTVPPLNVFVPVNTNAPAPVFVSIPPETTPGIVSTPPEPTSTTASPAPITSERFTPKFTLPDANRTTEPPDTLNPFVAEPSPKFPDAVKPNVPPVTDTPPLNVFTPLNVKVPEPDFSNPVDPATTPGTVRTFEPVTSKRPPPVPNVTPRPDPKSTDAPVLCNTPPCNVNPEPVPNPDAAPTDKTPALTVTAPLNVFTPLNVNVPLPVFVRLVNPLTTLLKVTSDDAASVVAALNATAPETVSAPVFTASPNVTVPDKLNAFASVRAVTPSLVNAVPDASVTVPVPNAALFPTRTVPAFTTVPPPYKFAPPNTNVPAPAFVSANVLTPSSTTPPTFKTLPPTVNVNACPNVTEPVPKSKSLPPVKVIFPFHTCALFVVSTTADPNVLFNVAPPTVNVPLPNAVALFTFNVDPDATVTPPVIPLLSPESVSDPALTAVKPPYAKFPDNTNPPAPAFVSVNVPTPSSIAPPTVKTLADVVTVEFCPNVTAPVPKFRDCVPANVNEPPTVTALFVVNARLATDESNVVPAEIVKAPDPNALAFPNDNVPCTNANPPEPVFAPFNETTPAPVFETPAVKVTAPPIVKLEAPVPTTCHVCAVPASSGALIATAPPFASTKIPVELELGEMVNVPPVP